MAKKECKNCATVHSTQAAKDRCRRVFKRKLEVNPDAKEFHMVEEDVKNEENSMKSENSY
jgi:hypothetical protein